MKCGQRRRGAHDRPSSRGVAADRGNMSNHPDWDRQFAETEDERAERWRSIKAVRKAAGKCWQCAKPIAICICPNIKHPARRTVEGE